MTSNQRRHLNAIALILILGASLGLGARATQQSAEGAATLEGQGSVVDANGVDHPIADYRRIVSASTIADQVFARLLPSSRIAAVAAYTQRNDFEHWRYEGKPTIEALEDLEAILALSPDLVVVSNIAAPARVQRLRERGLRVFNLGAPEGEATLLRDLRLLGRLVGQAARADALASRFERRFDRVGTDGGTSDGPAGLYVTRIAGQLYGGTVGTSYHDVLRAAGMTDVAAEDGLRSWPTYGAEDLLRLAPAWLVVPKGSDVCAHPGLDALAACAGNRLLEVDGNLLGDPGFGMLPAAEALAEAIEAQR